MVQARDEPASFPHIGFRNVAGRPEAHILGTGLAVWEVALLARGYGDDAEAIAAHTQEDRLLVEEGLRYAVLHRAATDAEIDRHTADSPEELRGRVPGVRMLVTGKGIRQDQSP